MKVSLAQTLEQTSNGIDERNLPKSATNYALLEFLDGTRPALQPVCVRALGTLPLFCTHLLFSYCGACGTLG